MVTRTGIDESITKLYESSCQRGLLKEHLIVYSHLGDIIENSVLVNQALESKGREKYKCWNYYLCMIIIDENEYLLEFEVVTMSNGENHYRVQKLRKI